MAAQLTCDPIIKITLTSNEVFDEVAPGYQFDSFRLTKGLLRPNRFEFVISKEDLTLEAPDITFELRNKLLAAMVEVTLQSRREENGEIQEYEVEDFFYGYIQNIKVFRTNSGAVRFRCTAFSPDAKMKHHPANNTYIDTGLSGIVAAVTSYNAFEKMCHFDKKEGTYDIPNNCLETEINLINESADNNLLPYTVQYNESPYNFLKRMARRYGQFMYYENRKFHFGDLNPLEEIRLHTGNDLRKYIYEMNMNDHNGIDFNNFDTFRGELHSYGFQKRNGNNQNAPIYTSAVNEDEYENEMAISAFETASDYFGDYANSFVELGSQPLFDTNPLQMEDTNENKYWFQTQRNYLERYVMSDSLICTGTADRVDLKLGTVIIIEDDTKTGAEIEEKVEHKPLKIIELTYIWDKEKWNMEVRNTFKAIPKEACVPPYLERDQDGFLMYGDFDLYPQCGPHYGRVIDNRDPEHLGRVRVCLSWQEAFGYVQNADYYKQWDVLNETYNVTPWIWVLSPYQGWEHESLLIPEIGDRVLVGFEHNNAERPYVMGARYSVTDPMSSDWQKKNENNKIKGFRTRSGHTVEFIDKQGDIKDDRKYHHGGKIHIYDSRTHAYDILFDTDQQLIQMTSKGNIELYADNDIIMHAGNDVSVTAENDVSVKAEKKMFHTAGEDITQKAGRYFVQSSKDEFNITAGKKMNQSVMESFSLDVREQTFIESRGEIKVLGDQNLFVKTGENIMVKTDDDMNLQPQQTLRADAKNIVLVAKDEIIESSKDQSLKASNGIKINATSSIDLKAITIREN